MSLSRGLISDLGHTCNSGKISPVSSQDPLTWLGVSSVPSRQRISAISFAQRYSLPTISQALLLQWSLSLTLGFAASVPGRNSPPFNANREKIDVKQERRE